MGHHAPRGFKLWKYTLSGEDGTLRSYQVAAFVASRRLWPRGGANELSCNTDVLALYGNDFAHRTNQLGWMESD